MKKLFLTWQDKQSRKWYPIGQLTWNGEVFRFFYIQGAQVAREEANFQPLLSFRDFRRVYESVELFPMFANRVMPSSRPEYKQLIKWIALPESTNDPLAFLARTGGAKVTDNFEIFCFPELDQENNYNLHFFAHGLRYLPECSIKQIEQMNKGDKIYLAHAFQNIFEKDAMQLTTRDNHIVGFCPSYLLDDIKNLINQNQELKVCVERVNDDYAPLQFRLLCRLVVSQTKNYQPFSSDCYAPIPSLRENIAVSKRVLIEV